MDFCDFASNGIGLQRDSDRLLSPAAVLLIEPDRCVTDTNLSS